MFGPVHAVLPLIGPRRAQCAAERDRRAQSVCFTTFAFLDQGTVGVEQKANAFTD
jgi:hypothetical protein